MSLGQRVIYGAVMALAVFFVGQVVLSVGTLIMNLVFALAMGAFAIIAVTVATRMAGRKKR